MGLRRTPPPGMDTPSSSRPVNFPTEYPEFPTEFPPSSPPAPPPPPPAAPIVTRSLSLKPPTSNPKPPVLKLPSPKPPTPNPEPLVLGIPSPKLPRITPRNSLFPTEDPDNLTPHTGLLNLARVVNRPPATPQRPTANFGGAASNRRSIRRTPGAGRLNPLLPKLTARSPHANRAFETRRVERRKSGRYPTARETPRDLLRALSRQLAPTTAPYQPTPNQTPAQVHRASYSHDRRASDILFYSDPGHADEDDDANWLPRPRLSMNLNDLDDEDDLRSVRLSAQPEDLDSTHHSVEFGRRAFSEQPGRSSFGGRLSDRFEDFRLGEQSDIGEETVGDMSMMTAEDSMIGHMRRNEDDGEEIELLDEGEGDVTMRTELELEGDESLFLGNVDDTDSGEDPMRPETDYDTNGPDSDSDESPPEPTAREAALSRIGAGFEIKPIPAKAKPSGKKAANKKALPLSRHGHPLPQFPRSVIKKMAQNFGGGALISNETLDAIVAASESFFEQVSEDLAVYAGHAGRKTIEDSDMVQLLKRQRLITPQNTVFSLAQRHLPRELLQEVRMPVQKPVRPRAGKRAKQNLDMETAEDSEA